MQMDHADDLLSAIHNREDKKGLISIFHNLQCPNSLLVLVYDCLLYTSDAADERSSVDLGGRRIIKKKTITTPRSIESHI